MGRKCAVSSCPNFKNPVDIVHSFPLPIDGPKTAAWLEFVRMDCPENPRLPKIMTYGVCSRHFLQEDYANIQTKRLKKEAVPKILLGEFHFM